MTPPLRLSSPFGDWVATVDADVVTFEDAPARWTIAAEPDGHARVEGPEAPRRVIGAQLGETVWIGVDGHALAFEIVEATGRPASAARDQDALTPPMSATVVRVAVRPGDHVQSGDTLLVLEAMKMELPIRAPRESTVRAVHCAEGQLVQPGTTLVELDD